MRKIKEIIIHCSATREDKEYSIDDIKRAHLARGFADVGYHYVVNRDGSVDIGRTPERIGAHCKGRNNYSIGVCYIGGLDAEGKPKDTRTDEQKQALVDLLTHLKTEYPGVTILGHRDTSPDSNHNGKVDKWEWLKDCPCFDAIKEYAGL